MMERVNVMIRFSTETPKHRNPLTLPKTGRRHRFSTEAPKRSTVTGVIVIDTPLIIGAQNLGVNFRSSDFHISYWEKISENLSDLQRGDPFQKAFQNSYWAEFWRQNFQNSYWKQIDREVVS